MTQVEIWFRDSFESEVVEGDLVALTNTLNVARANGKEFAILDTEKGALMVETRNIIKAREKDEADAFLFSTTLLLSALAAAVAGASLALVLVLAVVAALIEVGLLVAAGFGD